MITAIEVLVVIGGIYLMLMMFGSTMPVFAMVLVVLVLMINVLRALRSLDKE